MASPFFYTETLSPSENIILLNEENSKYIVQVLRMENGEQLKLTDGKGNIYAAEITEAHKKKCIVKVTETNIVKSPESKVCIAMSPVKNNSRFEWFLEKATEMGVTEIIPLMCARTEKQHFRYDRMKCILISAMLQSQQACLPILNEPVKFNDFIKSSAETHRKKYIAHCAEESKTSLKNVVSEQATKSPNDSVILIGPEGDFTSDEITLALHADFIPVALGNTRLRTETAAIVAAALLCVD